MTILLNANPVDPVINTSPNFCNNTAIHLLVDSIPEALYQWSGPNGFISAEQNPIIENSSASNNGMYTVTATVNGCASTATLLLTLQPKPEFIIVPSCINNVYTLSILPNQNSFEVENASYSWTGPNAFTSTDNAIQITGLGHGVYEVTVSDAAGCLATNSISVVETICTVPNVITPNNDNNNDYFDLTSLDVSRIEIFSRWGRLVYEQNNYTNQWYGQNMRGKELPDSTYYYILYFNSGPEKQGWIFKTTKH